MNPGVIRIKIPANYGGSKIGWIKLLRRPLGFGLKETKDFVEKTAGKGWCDLHILEDVFLKDFAASVQRLHGECLVPDAKHCEAYKLKRKVMDTDPVLKMLFGSMQEAFEALDFKTMMEISIVLYGKYKRDHGSKVANLIQALEEEEKEGEVPGW